MWPKLNPGRGSLSKFVYNQFLLMEAEVKFKYCKLPGAGVQRITNRAPVGISGLLSFPLLVQNVEHSNKQGSLWR